MSFGRVCTVRIGDLEIVHKSAADLRVAFEVGRDKSRDPNSALVSLWGLDKSSRGKLEKQERLFCEIFAGYADEGEHRIFSGVLLSAETLRDGPGLVTVAEMADDGLEQTALRTINRTFPEGMEVSAVLGELVKATGLKTTGLASLNSYARLAGSAQMPRSWHASGQALGALHSFTRSLGFQYTIQNQEIVFLGLSSGVGNFGPLIRSENLEGSVTIDAEDTVSFSCRMIPDLLPGKPLRLDCESYSGDLVCVSSKHLGDTLGGAWSVAVDADPFSKIKTKGLRVV